MAQLETAYRVDVNVQPALKSLKDFKKEIEQDAIALAKLDYMAFSCLASGVGDFYAYYYA